MGILNVADISPVGSCSQSLFPRKHEEDGDVDDDRADEDDDEGDDKNPGEHQSIPSFMRSFTHKLALKVIWKLCLILIIQME